MVYKYTLQLLTVPKRFGLENKFNGIKSKIFSTASLSQSAPNIN
jgi:hypothetical protein